MGDEARSCLRWGGQVRPEALQHRGRNDRSRLHRRDRVLRDGERLFAALIEQQSGDLNMGSRERHEDPRAERDVGMPDITRLPRGFFGE